MLSFTSTANYLELSEDYSLIEKAIHYIEQNYQHQPELGEIAASAGLSEFHFQRLFTRWTGISPKRFLQFLTKENAKDLLRRSSVLDAAYSVGLSGPGRLHDLFVSTEAVTPGEYKTAGEGLEIQYGFHPTPFGEALIGLTGRGICHLSFVQHSRDLALLGLRSKWNRAELHEDPSATGALVEPIFMLGERPAPIPLYLAGTNFQLKVWEALLSVPRGSLTTYEQIAANIGRPAALRAVGTAIGHNPVAFLIPCHRVIRKMGDIGDYRWGSARKKALIGWENAVVLNSTQA